MNRSVKNQKYQKGFAEGQEAIRRKYHYSPSNPYDEDREPQLYRGWDDGATSAGWNDIYTNGIYTG